MGPAAGIGSPTPEVTWRTRTSTRFGYSIDYPTTWVVTEATADWPSNDWPTPAGTAVDRYGATAGATTYVTVSSGMLAPGETVTARRAVRDQQSRTACEITDTMPITFGGIDARRQDMVCAGTDFVREVVGGHGQRIFLLDWFSATPLSPADQALFDAMVARLTFV